MKLIPLRVCAKITSGFAQTLNQARGWLLLGWLGVIGVLPAPTQAAGILTNATFAALTQAMEGGGLVRIQVDGTITFDYTIDVAADTTLDATGRQLTLSGNNARRLFNVASRTQLTLYKLTLTSGSNVVGAALYNKGGTVIASNCVFSRNVAAGAIGAAGPAGASSYGAGEDGGNGADGIPGYGGAIYNLGTVNLYQCQLLNNKATGGAGGAGGVGGNGTWRGGNGGHGGNGAVALGGAIYNASSLYLSNCTFTSNASQGGKGGEGGTNGTGTTVRYAGGGGAGGAGAGGAIYNAGTLFAINSTFATNAAPAGNAASRGGFINNGAAAERGPGGGTSYGGAVENLGRAVLLQCTFYTNSVQGGAAGAGGEGGMGGAIGGNGGHGYGGSLDNAGTMAITNCTIAGGFAAGGQPGVTTREELIYDPIGELGEARGANLATRSGVCRLRNTLLASPAAGLNGYGSILDAGYNISSDNSCRFTAAHSWNATDPRLGPLTAQAGAPATMALLAGSPAIDRAAPVEGLTADQRGQPRPSGVGFDIGAYEAAFYSIQGKVTSGSLGIAGLKINLTSNTRSLSVVTDALGSYVFASLLPGVYEVSLSQAGVGFTPAFRTVHLDVLEANALQQDFTANPSRITDLQFDGAQRIIAAVGVPKLTYQAEASADLVHWQTVDTNTAGTAGSLKFIDGQLLTEPQRFYRLESP